MSSTILMAIVLVVMWLVVLVPMFVRRHDERVESRSMDRFATAMRVLSRRAPGSGGVAGRRRYATTPPASYADGASPVRTAARAQMLRRRRRTLTTLAVTAMLGLPLATVVSGILWALPAVAGLLLAGYVSWLRQQVRREQARRARRAALFAEPSGAGAATAHGHSPTRRRPLDPSRLADPTAGLTAEDAEPVDDRSWRPVPVPTPTYVTAPVHHRRIPETVVDLDDDDLSFADLDPLGDAVERKRAVNE
jgi:type II secretory pathway pseudopilin PulG